MEVLVINGHDYSRFVERKGLEWARNDLDSEKTKRTKDGKMRRDKITTKRTIGYKLVNMSQEEMAQLDDDLSDETFSAKYLDLHGVKMKTFYCSSFKARLSDVQGEISHWDEAAFTMIEV